MPNAEDTIPIAKVSQYLASETIAKGALFSPYRDPKLDRTIYMARKSMDWMYAQDPTFSTLQNVTNYVYWLCGKFALRAQYVISGGTGGIPVIPGVPTGGDSSVFPIHITASDFADATNYNDTRIVGQNLAVFINSIPTYLFAGAGFEYTATGINITIQGFDATQYQYDIVIEKVSVGQGGGSGGAIVANFYYGLTDYTSDLDSGIDSVSYVGTFGSTDTGNLANVFPAGAAAEPMYLVMRVPDTQAKKNTWYYDPYNQGVSIPDSVWSYNTFGGYRYYYTKATFAFDGVNMTITLST